jgi:ribosomal protein S18 acetylase RimI-like enzyme
MNVTLRAATAADRPFIERVYFQTQRRLITELFGWRGDDYERAKFCEFYPNNEGMQIIVAEARDVGWLLVHRSATEVELDGIYIEERSQRVGIGTFLIRDLIAQAAASRLPLRLSTAKINPARTLYERLGFVVTSEDRVKVYMQYSDFHGEVSNHGPT